MTETAREVTNSDSYWRGKEVLVAGGGGFVGSHLVVRLVDAGSRVTVVGRSEPRTRDNLQRYSKLISFTKGDLFSQEDCKLAVRGKEIVFNLVGTVGGIAFNVEHPGTLLYANVIPNLNLLEACRHEKVDRFQFTSSTCVYSTRNSVGALEAEGFEDDPDPSVLGYGWAKRVGELQAIYYAKEFGMNISIVRPSNMYGPRDDFGDATSHAIPALIKRIVGATGVVNIWGSGNQTRSFLFASDAVGIMMDLLEHHPTADPVNLGNDDEVTIRVLAETIARISKSRATLRYDLSKPEGQSRKFPNTNKLKSLLGHLPHTSLEDGLTATIKWYLESGHNQN